jgi:hypothetical protein
MLTLNVSTAVDRDFTGLYQFLFEKPHGNIRKRNEQEVRQMINAGLFLLAKRGDNGRIVGVCYVETPESTAEKVYEFGGAFVDPEHRGLGLFRILGRVAIINQFVMEKPAEPLIGHVLVGNAGPRSGLEDLGFRISQSHVGFQPAGYPGLEHMETDEDGYVYADIYGYEWSQFCDLLREEVNLPKQLRGPSGSYTVNVRLAAWQNEKQVLKQVLREC